MFIESEAVGSCPQILRLHLNEYVQNIGILYSFRSIFSVDEEWEALQNSFLCY